MPKRIIDADAVWASTKLARCREEFIPEYTWLYGLADAYGNFEIDIRVIHGKVAAIRPSFSRETLQAVIEDFHKNGLLFIWNFRGKRYGHWTGSDKPGRLPPKSQREHHPKLTIPESNKFTALDEDNWPELKAYLAQVELAPTTAPLFEGLPTAEEIKEEAEALAEGYAKKAEQNGDDTSRFIEMKWQIFWSLYPNKRRPHGAWLKFKRIPVLELDDVIAAIEVWEASALWSNPQYIPLAVNFLTKQDWKDIPPKELNGKPNPDTRDQRNLEAFGLSRPKVDVRPR